MKLDKKIIITSIICFLISGTIGVVASKLSAKDIGFTSTNENWQVNNVEDAMNDLYEKNEEAINSYSQSHDLFFISKSHAQYDVSNHEKVIINIESFTNSSNLSIYIDDTLDSTISSAGIYEFDVTNATVFKIENKDGGIATVTLNITIK